MNALGNAPLGAEIIPIEKPKGGAAPWERAGAGHAAPTEADAQAKARRWEAAAAEMAAGDLASVAAREARREERQRRKDEAARAAEQKLEDTARRMYLMGFAALPFVWLVSVLYFWRELTGRSEGEEPVGGDEEAVVAGSAGKERIRKHVRCSAVMLVVYTLAFVAWVAAYQIWSARTAGLLPLSILKSTSNLG